MNEQRSKSMLFLLEQLFVIIIFAVCSAVCVKIFAGSYQTAMETSALNNAMLIAANGAEVYKAAAGPEQAAKLLGGTRDGDTAEVFYDESWRTCDRLTAGYVMRLSYRLPETAEGSVVYGDISVGTLGGEEIFAVTAARRGGYE